MKFPVGIGIPPDIKAVVDRSMSNLEEMLTLLREIRDLLKEQQKT